ncbi:MAG TPA: hypothetical protein VM573_07600 [Actinomycetota bacterium]|jgi:photosystem II stability/assembly factor-like uncharacterized protein|nr:hypothetical protein [Actinomycetota bacterium]
MKPRSLGTRPLVGILTLLLLVGSLWLAPVKAQVAVWCRATGNEAWVTLEGPSFEEGPSEIRDLAVPRLRSNRIFATNGSEILRVTDGGCQWGASHRPGEAVRSLAATAAAERIWALLETSGPSGPAARVEVSEDEGSSWREASAGLPPAGAPEALAIVEALPDFAYLLIDVGGGTADLLYATQDGGRSWVLRSDLTKVVPNAGITNLTADPIDPSSLWAYGPGGLYHSTDGGRSFTPVEEFTGRRVGPVDVVHTPDAPAVVTAFRPETADLARSEDGGEQWYQVSAPGPVSSVAHGRSASDLIVSSVGRVWGYHAASFSWIDLRAPEREVTGLEGGVRDVGPIYYGHAGRRIVVYIGPTGERLSVGGGEIDFLDLPGFGFPRGTVTRPPSLEAEARRVQLAPGESRRVRYRLDLPKRPVPLDLFFLVDTTHSMEKLINDLKVTLRDIAADLAARNLDARFGLAESRTFPDQAVPAPDERNFVYRLQVQLTHDPDRLIAALEVLTADAGGRYEGNLASLHQAVTGSGLDLDPPGPVNDVPPGQQADFRRNALRVIVHATNSRSFDHPQGGPILGLGAQSPPKAPGWDETIDALNDGLGVEHVGIAVGNLDGTAEALQRVSAGTGSRAYGAPVDCDGDGLPDLSAGEPLVCPLAPSRVGDGSTLAPAIVNLVDAIQTKDSVGIRPTRGRSVIDEISPEIHRDVVLQSANVLEFDVRYRCGQGVRGRRVPVTLEAHGAGLTGVEANTVVVCSTTREDVVPPIPPITTPIALLVIPPAAPPPPAYTGQAQAQAQSQAQAQAQGALAQQEEEQPQLAFAAQATEELATEEELSMSAYRERRRTELPPAMLYSAAAATGLAFTFLTRRRTRVQEARATWRT